MGKEVIDFLIPSSSRFDCLKPAFESLQKNMHYSGEFRYFLHEDVFDKHDAKEVVKFAQDNNFIFKADDPKIGFGPSVSWLLSQATSKYFFYWEDDWELIREVDLDALVALMDNNPKINQIAFHKRKIMAQKQWFTKKTINVSGIDLTTSMHWSFIPALWRRDFIKKYLRYYSGNPAWTLNIDIKGHGDAAMWDSDKVIERLGTYFLGKIREAPYVLHLGTHSRRKEMEKRLDRHN